MLQYDTVASVFFFLTLLVFYLVPATYVVVSRLKAYWQPSDALPPGYTARTTAEKEKAQSIARKLADERVRNVGFIFLAVSTVLLWILVVYLASIVSENAEIAQFDPFAILGVDSGATEAEIKKAYRKASLQYHPDKNPGNKQAEQMFMMIAKAYGALTDAEARDNWEKYGNPDGKQSMEVFIGLPQWLIEKSNHNLILVLYLVALVVIIPLLVGCWYSQSKRYGEKMVMFDTYHKFYRALNENIIVKMLPEVLALAEEFRGVNSPAQSRAEEVAVLAKTQAKDMPKLRFKDQLSPLQLATVQKGVMLITAHVREEPLGPLLQQDLRQMLIRAPDLINAMVDICSGRRWWHATTAAIEFSQCIHQGLWPALTSAVRTPFLQLPNFTTAEVGHVFSGKGNKAKNFREYLELEDDQKKGMTKMEDGEREESLAVCHMLPRLRLSARAFVQGQKEIAEKDLVTLRVKFVRENIEASPWDDEESDDDLLDLEFDEELFAEDENDDDAGAKSDDEDAVLIPDPKAEAKADPKSSEQEEAEKKDLAERRAAKAARRERDQMRKRYKDGVPPGAPRAEPVYAPRLPVPREESWYVFVGDKQKGSLLACDKVTSQARVVRHDMRVPATRVGTYSFDVAVKSANYLGLDCESSISFSVIPESEVEKVEAHPDDLELDQEPTLFEAMLVSHIEEDSESEDEDDSDDEGDDEEGESSEEEGVYDDDEEEE